VVEELIVLLGQPLEILIVMHVDLLLLAVVASIAQPMVVGEPVLLVDARLIMIGDLGAIIAQPFVLLMIIPIVKLNYVINKKHIIMCFLL
jgi:hypothetical protein